LGFGLALAPINPDMSRLVAFEIQVMTLDLELNVLCFLIVKYFSIYHSSMMNGTYFDETKIIVVQRIALAAIAMILGLIEYRFLTPIDNLTYYQLLAMGESWVGITLIDRGSGLMGSWALGRLGSLIKFFYNWQP
jgi:hypothetical protein